MKKLFKTFLLAIVACACFSLVSCSKSAEQIAKEASELVAEDGSIAADNIDDALDLYETACDKVIALEDDIKKAGESLDFSNPVLAEAAQLATAADVISRGLANSQLSPEQQSRKAEIDAKLAAAE